MRGSAFRRDTCRVELKASSGLCHQRPAASDLRRPPRSPPARDVYYLPSGHAAVLEDDFDSLEFSTSAVLEQVLDVVKRNPAMAQTASI
jgi:hypothetical protein